MTDANAPPAAEETFSPLTGIQIEVFNFCIAFVSGFISTFRYDWFCGIKDLESGLAKIDEFRKVKFSNVFLSHSIAESGGGYSGWNIFTMENNSDQRRHICLTLTVRFENDQYTAACSIEGEKGADSKSIFAKGISRGSNIETTINDLIGRHYPDIFDEVNRRLGLVGDLPKLTPQSIILK